MPTEKNPSWFREVLLVCMTQTAINIYHLFQGSGHGGSHPHLVHEFLSALVEESHSPMPDSLQISSV